MESVTNAVNAASKAIWGEPTAATTTSTDATIPRTVPDETVGQESVPDRTATTSIGEPTTGTSATSTDATASRTLPNQTGGQEPLSGVTGNTSAGEPFDKGNESPSTLTSSQQQPSVTKQIDPLGHTNRESEVGGPSSTAHSNVKEPGFTQTTERSEETGARDDIKGSVAEDRSNVTGTAPVSTSDGPVERVGEGLGAGRDNAAESGNPPAATSKNKDTNDETTDVKGGQADSKKETGKGADKISILKTGQHPYGDANVPAIIAKDLKEGEHPSEKLTGHPEGKGEQYATFTDPEAASSAKGADVEKMAKSGKVNSGDSDDAETEGKEKLSLKDKIKAKIHRH